jgi:hypothetical protein
MLLDKTRETFSGQYFNFKPSKQQQLPRKSLRVLSTLLDVRLALAMGPALPPHTTN